MSRKKSHKKDQQQKPDTGAALAAKSSSVSFPILLEEPQTSKRQAL